MSATTTTAPPSTEPPTWSCVSCDAVNAHTNAVCSMCATARFADSHASRHRTIALNQSAWEVSSAMLAKLVTRLAKPATTVFNSALVGAFAVAGASIGAVAGAVAARATSRGVVRGASVGAVAGAAVSVEALDLARLCLSGYSVAGAMERRETRLALLSRNTHDRPRAGNSTSNRGNTDRRATDRRVLPSGRALGRRSTGTRRAERSGRVQSDAPRNRFAATTTAVIASDNRIAGSTNDPTNQSQLRQNNRPLAIRARRAEVDLRNRELERLVARGDVERILHELFRGGERRVLEGDRGGHGRIGDTDTEGSMQGSGEEHIRDMEEGTSMTDYSLYSDTDYSDLTDDDEYESLDEHSRSNSWNSVLEAMFTASRLDTMSYEELLDSFGPGNAGVKPAPIDLVRKMPIKVVGKFSCGSCVVCLEGWTAGDTTKTLNTCGHTFHAVCIDRWLTKEQNACPVCRQTGVEKG